MIVFASCALACASPPSQPDRALFRGTVRIIVPFTPGGGLDVYARTLAPHLSRHLPGAPAVIVENMPGAGGLVAANYLAQRALPDGLTLATLSLGSVLAALLDDPGIRFDARRFRFIGAPVRDVPVCVVRRGIGIDFESWRAGKVTPRIGAAGHSSNNDAYMTLLTSALGLPVRPVIGYPGTADLRFAMANGEIDGVCVSLSAFNASFEPKSQFDVVLQGGDRRAPGLEHVALASELVSDDEGGALLGALARLANLTRYYALPPATPDAVWRAMVDAFEATMQDQDFRRAAREAHLELSPVGHGDVARDVAALLDLPPQAKQRLVAALSRAR